MTNPAGNGYRGTVNKAASGRACMNWKDVENYTISVMLTVDDISVEENYCRRIPFTEWNGPSCVTVDDDDMVRLERCDVPYCGTDSFYTYIIISITVSHAHSSYTNSSGFRNFCRQVTQFTC